MARFGWVAEVPVATTARERGEGSDALGGDEIRDREELVGRERVDESLDFVGGVHALTRLEVTLYPRRSQRCGRNARAHAQGPKVAE